MYYITRASVKMASKRYSRSQHDMEVVLRPDSEVIFAILEFSINHVARNIVIQCFCIG